MTEIVVGLLGQSLAAAWITVSASPPAANTNTYIWNGSAWVAPTGNGVIAFANAINNATGLPVYVYDAAVNAAPLCVDSAAGTENYWLSTAAGSPRPSFFAMVAAGGKTPNVILYNGSETDCAGTLYGALYNGLTSLYSQIRAQFGVTTTQLPFVLNLTGKTSLFTVAPYAGHVKWAEINWALSTAGAFPGCSRYDLPTVDGTHRDGAGYGKEANRSAFGVCHALGVSGFTHSGFGPTITGVARSGASLLYTVAHNGGDSLFQANPLIDPTGFEVWTSNYSALLPIARAAIVGPAQIRVDLANDPAGPVQAGYQWDNSADIANPIYDNVHPFGDVLGLPMLPTGLPFLTA